MRALELRFEDIGSRISWEVTDPEALFPAETPEGDLEWVCLGQGEVLLGVTFRELLAADDKAPEYETERIDGNRYRTDTADYPVHPDTEVTIHPAQTGSTPR